MENSQSDFNLETQRLAKTISLAKNQLEKAKNQNKENKEAIHLAKQELRENAPHSVANLWSSDGFEALAAISQYVNPVTDKIAGFEAIEDKIAQLNNLIQSPYFARIDFQFDDEEEMEEIYIGRSSLIREDSYEMVVYDWRSPIASVFYRFVLGKAYYEAPDGNITGEVHLKRQYEIKEGQLQYYFDADLQIVDSFLRTLLSQNASPQMKTVVETIQRDQDIVIRDLKNDLMMVQGVAGSGKTSIALHRAAYLMYQGLSERISANNIIIISPNTLFEQYIANVLPELGEDMIVSLVFDEIIQTVLNRKAIQSRNEFLEDLITYRDDELVGITKNSIEFKTSPEFLIILNRFIEDMPRRFIEFQDIYYASECIIKKEDLKERLLSGRKETPLGMKLQQLEEYVIETIRDIRKSAPDDLADGFYQNELKPYIEPNLQMLYQMLLKDRDYFYQLAEGVILPERILDILLYSKRHLNSGILNYDDAIVLLYLHLKIYGMNEYKNIKQIVIDEAQDYYPLQYEIFRLLFPKAKYTVLGDVNQTLDKNEDISLYTKISTILKKKKSTLVTMDKSFRCTNEILNFSLKFIKDSIPVKSFNRSGTKPEVFKSLDQQALTERLVAEINYCKEKGYGSVGLLCKSEKNARKLYESLKEHREIQLIHKESQVVLEGVFIIPIYMSKGLEFDAVLLCDTDNKNYQKEADKKLLYIACTRALHYLQLFCVGEASPLL